MGAGIVYLIVIGACLIAVLFYFTLILPTQWLKVERVQVPLKLGLKILQMSDLHVERNRIRPNTLERVIRRERPDLICLTGDYLDQSSSFLLLIPFLKMIQSTGVPAYAVLGNHDYMLKRPSELVRLLEEFDIRVLSNRTEVFDTFNLVGLDDFDSGHSDEVAFSSVISGKPIIVMTHDPTVTLFMKYSFDYLFAGHLHGKQFNLPFFFLIRNMGPLAASGIFKGLHPSDKGRFYISKGIGQSGLNFRFFVRSEITLHEV